MAQPKSGARVRAVAAEALDAVVSGGRSSDAVLEAFAERVAADDRPLLRMLVFGCLRRHWRLSAWLAALLDRPMVLGLARTESSENALMVVLHATKREETAAE